MQGWMCHRDLIYLLSYIVYKISMECVTQIDDSDLWFYEHLEIRKNSPEIFCVPKLSSIFNFRKTAKYVREHLRWICVQNFKTISKERLIFAVLNLKKAKVKSLRKFRHFPIFKFCPFLGVQKAKLEIILTSSVNIRTCFPENMHFYLFLTSPCADFGRKVLIADKIIRNKFGKQIKNKTTKHYEKELRKVAISFLTLRLFAINAKS